MESLPWELRDIIFTFVPAVYRPYMMQVNRGWYGLLRERPCISSMQTLFELVGAGDAALLSRMMKLSVTDVDKFVAACTTHDCLMFVITAARLNFNHVVKWIAVTPPSHINVNLFEIITVHAANPIELMDFFRRLGYTYNIERIFAQINGLSNGNLGPLVHWFEERDCFGIYRKPRGNFNYKETISVSALISVGLYNILRLIDPLNFNPQLLLVARENISDDDLKLLINRPMHQYRAIEIAMECNTRMRTRICNAFGWAGEHILDDARLELKAQLSPAAQDSLKSLISILEKDPFSNYIFSVDWWK